jgi:hypothetical protein
MKLPGILLALLISISLMSGQTRQQTAQKSSSVSSGFTGSGFVDYSYYLKNNSVSAEGINEFTIRRINLGYEHAFTRNVLAYAELEAGHEQAMYDYGEYIFKFKQAFVELKNLLPQMRLVMGLSPTPAVVTSERIWGYRMLDPLPLELYGFAPVVDNGIAAKGKIDPDGIVSYHVMVGNGTGTYGESNKTKRLYGSLGLSPGQGLTVEGYADFENGGNGRYVTTMKALAGVEGSGFAVGLEGTAQINHHIATAASDVTPYAASLYAWIGTGEEIRVVCRGDFFDPDYNKSSSGIRTIQAMAGIDYRPANDVHIVPNIVYTTYSNKQSGAVVPNDGITVRLSAGFSFSSLR